ncbi:hypothetical protein EDF68_101636 [Ochrobactrum sp. BH3]|nr:hypothetical protein EDF68_101636 [Ochrobactrum sp. BH3]
MAGHGSLPAFVLISALAVTLRGGQYTNLNNIHFPIN